MVAMLARSVDHKGSNVRVCTNEQRTPSVWPRRPIDPAWWSWQQVGASPFQKESSITELEARAVV
eukprot:3153577-Prorocentrum_lima.AAC.1